MTAMARQTPKWYMLAVILISVIGLAGANVSYTNRVQRDAERKWCLLVVALGDAYRLSPPLTDTGARVAKAIELLRADLHCPDS